MSSTETATIAGVRFTHPDKEVFPADHVTKRALADYLTQVAPRMLPHVTHRLLSLVRCPDGQGAPCFYQRHILRGFPKAIRQMTRPEKRDVEDYIYIEDLQGLLALAQMGVLEVHVWGSSIDRIEQPDRMVFDLDPAPDVPFPLVREAALRVRDVLDALGLKSFPMLSGGKGVHVVVPIAPKHEWPVVKAFSGAVAERIATDQPERYVATMTKAKRHGKVFIDFFRNDKTATAIAPYSTRARPGAPLAWPMSWTMLPRVRSASDVTIATYRQRLKGRDPWAGYHQLKQGLTAAALKALGVKV
jgi:bifunctional non-homologous end joining protein LigD